MLRYFIFLLYFICVNNLFAAELIFNIEGIPSNKGRIRAALFANSDGFPSSSNKALMKKVLLIKNKNLSLYFQMFQKDNMRL